jgi:hypothetical protein
MGIPFIIWFCFFSVHQPQIDEKCFCPENRDGMYRVLSHFFRKILPFTFLITTPLITGYYTNPNVLAFTITLLTVTYTLITYTYFKPHIEDLNVPKIKTLELKKHFFNSESAKIRSNNRKNKKFGLKAEKKEVTIVLTKIILINIYVFLERALVMPGLVIRDAVIYYKES